MSVYLGEDGTLLIKRKADTNGLLRSMLDPEDVNPSRNRFSFDFPHEAIISGDRIEIYTANKLNLELVEGHDQPDGMWYAHVDDSGGVRLYDEFEQAINGGYSKALALKKADAHPRNPGTHKEQSLPLSGADASVGDHHKSCQCRCNHVG